MLKRFGFTIPDLSTRTYRENIIRPYDPASIIISTSILKMLGTFQIETVNLLFIR
jgi:hypothetical protein